MKEGKARVQKVTNGSVNVETHKTHQARKKAKHCNFFFFYTYVSSVCKGSKRTSHMLCSTTTNTIPNQQGENNQIINKTLPISSTVIIMGGVLVSWVSPGRPVKCIILYVSNIT